MFNPIEEKRRLVQERIAKSFDSGINVTDEIELEKAHKDGDHHPTKPWVWVSSANGGKGDWRVEGGRSHKKAGAGTATSATGNKVDISKIPDAEFKRITQMLEKKNPDHRDAERYLEEEAMSDNELKNFYAVAEHFKNSSNINKMTQEYCKKWAELAKQEMQSRNKKSGTADTVSQKDNSVTSKEFSKNKAIVGEMLKDCDSKIDSNGVKKYHCKFYALGKDRGSSWFKKSDIEAYLRNYNDAKITAIKSEQSSTTPAARKPGSTDEIERMTPTAVHNAILGLNNTGTNVKDKGDHFLIEFDANDFTTHGQRSPQIDRIAKYLESMGASCVIGKNNIKAYKKVKSKKDSTQTDVEIDQAAYDKAYKAATSKGETEKHLKESLDKANKNIKEIKDGISTSSVPIVIDKMKKMLKICVSQKKAIEDALKLYDKGGTEITKKRYNLNPDGTPMDLSKIEDDNLRFSTALVKTNIRDLKNKLAQTSDGAVVTRKNLNAQIEDQEGKLAEMEEEINKRANSKSTTNKTQSPQNKVGDFGNMKLTEILDSLDDWGDDEWNNSALNKKLSDAISNAIKKERISETEFNNIAKKYQGLDLMYSDYAETKPDFEEYSKKFIEDYRKNHPNDKAKNSELRGKALDAYEKKYESDSYSDEKDTRDKIAQDAGFKDYQEMKGYQDYVTQKNLLKKRSTSAGMRLLYQQEIDKYEKNHADLLARLAKGKNSKDL